MSCAFCPMNFVSRTRLPKFWVTGEIRWMRLWARRWLYLIVIFEAELRSVVRRVEGLA